MGLFHWLSTKRKLAELEAEFELLKRSWKQVEQDWDATSARVSKVLRRIATSEAAARAREEEQQPDVPTNEPLTTMATSSERMGRIRQQLAARGRS